MPKNPRNWFGRSTRPQEARSRRRRRLQIEQMEQRRLLAAEINIGAVRPDTGFANNLLAQYLDTQPLASGDSNPEITFHYGFSATSNNGVGLQGFDDTALAGDLSGVGFDQSIVVRPFEGALQWLGDTDRDTTQEYLFRFGLADMTPLIADMNGDGVDDVIAVDTTTTSNLLEWYVHYGVPGANPFPTNDSTLSTDATFSFGVDADHIAAVGGLADIPRVGDIDGDGRADVLAVRRGATTKDWYVHYADGSGPAYPNNFATVVDLDLTVNGYGANAAIPVVGDWDNDGDDNIGAVDNTATLTWNLDTNGGGAAEITKLFGLAGDQVIVGKWADVLWDGSSDSNWGTTANWSSGAAPSATDDVVVDQPTTTTTLLVTTGSATAGSLVTREGLSVNGGTLTIEGTTTSTTAVDVAGGTLRLNGLLDATALNLNFGNLDIGADNVIGSTPLTAGNASQFRAVGGPRTLSNPIVTTAGTVTIGGSQNLTLNGIISGPGAVLKQNTTTVTLAAINTYSGSTTIQGGTLVVSGRVSGGGDVVVDGGFVNVASAFAISGGLVRLISGGIEAVGGPRTISNAIQLEGNITAREQLTFSEPMLLVGGNHTITLNGTTAITTLSGGISDGGNGYGLTISGTLPSRVASLSGTNTYTGDTTVIGATLRLDANNVIPDASDLIISGTLDLNGRTDSVATISGIGNINLGAGQLTVGGSNANSVFSGSISGSGTLTKTGNGELTLDGNNTFSGTTFVNAGVLKGSGSLSGSVNVASGATVAPGNSPGVLDTGNFNLASGATLEIEVGGLGANAGTDYDQVNVTGTVTLAGDLDVTRFSDFAFGQSYTIINNDGTDAVSGTFAGLAEGATVQIGDNNFFTISYVGGTGSNDVVLTSTSGMRLVGSTSDSGAGTLRQAITDANASAGLDTIVFDIAGAGPHVIAPSTLLPLITQPVTIDGSAQSGYSGTPLIELDGSNVVGSEFGLNVFANNSVIKGLSITDWSFGGLRILGDQVKVQSNYFGVRPDGTTVGANASGGVWIFYGSDNVIGTDGDGVDDANEGNVISGNTTVGVYLQSNGSSLSSNNVIAGNRIGVNPAGTAQLGTQQYGVRLFDDFIDGTIIGTNGDGVSDALEANIIAGNTLLGISVEGADNSVIAGNYIGSNAAGDAVIAGGQQGIAIQTGASFNRVGTDANGTSDTLEQNVIVGSTTSPGLQDFGVQISGASSDSNVVAGNYIGIAADGITALANGTGVFISASAANNLIGGDSAVERNIISGNTGSGVLISDVGTTDNTVLGNYIGVGLNGSTPIMNNTGVSITGGASSNVIGGGAAGAGNVIAGNAQDITITGSGTDGNLVQGNRISTTADGLSLIAPTFGYGIYVANGANDNVIGTDSDNNDDATEGNLIGFASTAAVFIQDVGAAPDGTIIAGNRIGLDANGAALSAGGRGIWIQGGINTRIGSDANGTSDDEERNVIVPGTSMTGILVTDGTLGDTTGTTIAGNYLGVNIAGLSGLSVGANSAISFQNANGNAITGNTIGGTSAAARNVIGSTAIGIDFVGADVTGNTISGNYIGTDTNGANAIANGTGIRLINGAHDNILGGTAVETRNIISGNSAGGVIFGTGTSSNIVQGNYIGLNAAGDAALGNAESGIRLNSAGSGNIIGGSAAGARNVISGNLQGSNAGSGIVNTDTSGTIIQGNYIGLNAAGTAAIGNQHHGITTSGGPALIGTDGDGNNDATEGNVIGGNGLTGISIGGSSNTTENVIIAGNQIGTNAAGTASLGAHTTAGIYFNPNGGVIVRNVRVGTDANGTSDTLERNLISGNTGSGVFLTGATTSDNTIAGNYIGTNATGSTAIGNQFGILIQAGASNSTIGGALEDARNVISGNNGAGIESSGAGTGTLVQGNYFGVDVAGTVSLQNYQVGSGAFDLVGVGTVGGVTTTAGTGAGNLFGGVVSLASGASTVQGNTFGLASDGVTVLATAAPLGVPDTDWAGSGLLTLSDGHTIGGTTAGAGNVFGGHGTVQRFNNGHTHVNLRSSNNIVQGNLVGTDITGTIDTSDAERGIDVRGSGNLVGGLTASARNIVVGNNRGIELLASGNTVQGNYVGLLADGSTMVGNTTVGVFLRSSNNTIGGDAAGAGNVIAGSGEGIHATNGTAGSVIAGNYIGTDATGTLARPNSTGVILAAADNVTVGGSSSLAPNLISGNSGYGIEFVFVGTDSTVTNNLVGTQLDGSTALLNGAGAIRIGGQAILRGTGTFTGNILNQATVAPGNSPGVITINGNYTQTAGATLEMELEGTNAAVPEFDQLIVNGSVSLNGFLDVSLLNSYLPSQGNSFRIIDNDGTDGINGTFTGLPEGAMFRTANSKFSITYVGGTGNDVVLTNLSTIFNVTTTSDAGPGSLRQAILDANSHSGLDEIEFDIPTSDGNYNSILDVWTISPTSSLPTISEIVYLDGTTQNGFTTRPVIELRGDSAGSGVSGLTITAAGSIIEGLIINRFDGSGISLTGPGTTGNTIRGNYIGVSADGVTDLGNVQSGVRIAAGASNNFIGSNSTVDGTAGSSVILLTEDFDDYTGTQAGTQPGTNFELSFGGDVPGWSKTGFNAVHAVDQGSGNFAPSFYDNNAITLATPVSANLVGQSYTVSLDVGPSVYTNVGQATQAGDGIVVSILRGNDTVLSSETLIPGAWVTGPNAQDLSTFTFTYTGDGSGDIRISISTNTAGTDRFGGAVDNLKLEAIANYNVISGNDVAGIEISSSNNNTVAGNIIGLNAAGTNALGNTVGISIISGSSSNTIGGNASTGPSNVISGNTGSGIVIGGAGAIGNTIQGNYIGTNATGSAGLGNGTGVFFDSAGTGNVLGVDGDGVNDENEGNLISGNVTFGGVRISNTPGVVIAGNWIGLNAAGNSAIPNIDTGIGSGGLSVIADGARIGTNGDGISDGFERNIIAGNVGYQVTVPGDGNTIAGNYIGTNATGTAGLGVSGILAIWGRNNRIGTNADEVNDAAERNVMSSIQFNFVATGNTVAGNYIGTDESGNNAVSNAAGVAIANTDATNNLIGGPTAASRNVIANSNDNPGIILNSTGNIVQGNYVGIRADGSGAINSLSNQTGVRVAQASNQILGNTIGGFAEGVYLDGSLVSGTTVRGNFIGTDPTGSFAIANIVGILIVDSSTNTIGGTTATDRNVISGNTASGVAISGAVTSFNVIEGNYIGTDVSGTAAIANSTGIQIQSGATNNTIGGTTADSRNIISGNSGDGIYLVYVPTATNNTIQGNYVGTDVTGAVELGNGLRGIRIDSNGNLVGGLTQGSGNLVSGNDSIGIWINGQNNQVFGNFVGTNATATSAIGNEYSGIEVGGSFNLIGGPTALHRNIVSGTKSINGIGSSDTGGGIVIYDAGFKTTTGNVVQGNYVGTDVTGTFALANRRTGIVVLTGVNTNANQIGGDQPGEGNLVSGNGLLSDYLSSAGILIGQALNTTVQGNRVGTNASGTASIPNQGTGIRIDNSGNNQIGGASSFDSGSLSGAGNVVSGNFNHGIQIISSGGLANENVVQGNIVGLDVSGTIALGNGQAGVGVGGSFNVIGDTDSSRRNIIASNNIGVGIEGHNNTILGNYIGTDVSGSLARGNQLFGLWMRYDSDDNTIGGTSAGAGNVISANGSMLGFAGGGIGIDSANKSNNSILGNFIGTDATGTIALGNTHGIYIYQNAEDVTIGSSAAGGENVISGNLLNGITFENAGPNHEVQNNFIGTDRLGALDLGNQGSGIAIVDSSDILIGGTTATVGNIIAFNGVGTTIIGTSQSNRIRRNSIYSNDGLGISLESGANGFQNYPILSPAVSGGKTRVIGQFASTPLSTFDIDIYASSVADPSGFGEGQRFLGSISVTTNVSGSVAFDTLIPATTVNGEFISAIATDSSGNSSEFSNAVSATSTLPPTISANDVIVTEISEDGFGQPATVFQEGQLVRLDGLFDNAETNAGHDVTIDWGDGSPVTTIFIPSAAPGFPDPRGFAAEHVYADDLPAFLGSDIYPITIVVADREDNASGAVTKFVTIQNTVPQFSGSFVATPSSGLEGGSTVLSGSFIDAGDDIHSLDINWGDGSPVQTVVLPQGSRTFSAPHVFRDDASLVSVTLRDDDGGIVAQSLNVSFANVAPVVSISGPLGGLEGTPLVLQAIGTDAGTLDTISYSWSVFYNDNQVFAASGNPLNFVPVDEGNYEIRLLGRDDDGAAATASVTVTIGNTIPVIQPSSLVLRDETGSIVSAANEGERFTLRGVFSDLGIDDSHQVTVTWGDGSPNTVLQLPAGSNEFFASHVYADDAGPGISTAFPVSIHVTDFDGGQSTLPTSISVQNVAPDVSIIDDGSDDTTVRLRARVVDPSLTDTHGFSWSFPGGTVPVGTPLNQATISFLRPVSGIASVQVIATDSDNASDTASAVIAVGTQQNDTITVQPGSLANSVLVSITSSSVTVSQQVPDADVVLIKSLGGADSINVSPGLLIDLVADAGADNDTIVAGDGNDTLVGGPGNDSIFTGEGFNDVNISSGDDSVVGGSRDDIYRIYGFSTKTISDPGGNDTLDFSGVSQPSTDTIDGVSVDLNLDSGQFQTVRTGGQVSLSGEFENAVGTPYKDYLSGTEEENLLFGGGGEDTLDGSLGDDSIIGGDGNDLIFGGVSGDDTIDAGSGDDSIIGSAGNDLIFGGVGDDTIDAGGGDDSLQAGDGNDLIFGGFSGDDTVDAGSGDDSIRGGDGNDLIFGGIGDDTITAGEGDDSLQAGEGNDLIFGGIGDGDDTITAGNGDDSITGGGGNDLIFGGTGDDTIESSSGDDSISGGSGNDVIFGGAFDRNDTIDGGSGDDSIVGGEGNDLIFGGLGEDTIQAGGGNESISGGEGNDLIFGGGDGNDTLNAGNGDDSIIGGDGNDLIFGGDGDDTITSGTGDESIIGGEGNDVIFGGVSDTDTIDGGSGDDSIVGSEGNDLIFGGDGDDTIQAGSGDESIIGGEGNDVIFGGGTGSDTIDGGIGDDSIIGGDGNDIIFGGDGDDTITAGSGDESIVGGEGNDVIFGGSVSNDTIDGSSGDDSIVGGDGNDFIFGGDGDDTIQAGTGDESIVGGDGNDVIFGGANSSDTIDGSSGDDSIVGGTGNDFIFGGDGEDTIQAGSGDESIVGGVGNDIIFGGSAGSDTIDGSGGDDSIIGGEGNDIIFGGDGDDTITAGSGDESIGGGEGNDIIFGGDGDDTIEGSLGDDSLIGGDGNDIVFGGDGDDTVGSSSGDDSLSGGTGNDLIFTLVNGDATITDTTINSGARTVTILDGEAIQVAGDSGANRLDATASTLPVNLVGGAGDDTLIGGAGETVIDSGDGVDVITGGSGIDVYRFSAGDVGVKQIVDIGGDDTLDFRAMNVGVTVDLSMSTVQSITSGLSLILSGDIENAFGSDYNDTFIGNSLDNKLYGYGGADFLDGRDGNDNLQAGRRRYVYLDFDSATESNEYQYSQAERDAIQARIENDYAAFDVEFSQTVPQEEAFVSIVFNAAVFVPGSNFVLGGVSNRVGWRELSIDDFVHVDVNGFFGTTANKLSPTSVNYVALSSTIASHELGHTYGLRHLDAFGPPGSGVFSGVGNNARRFRPIYTGPATASETRFHLIASPASVGTSLVDALGNPYFGQREALKLAFAESGSTVAESSSKSSVTLGSQTRMVQPLGDLPGLAVPNTVIQGTAAGQPLSAAAINVVGRIELAGATSENDLYSFSGSTGDVVTIEVISESLRHRVNNVIDSVIRVYDGSGQKIAYYSNSSGAFNDDQMEPTDSVLLDLVLPHNGTFYVEIDTFSFSMPEIPNYLGQFNVTAFCSANPTHIACTDTDTGPYELLIYRFDGTVAQTPEADTLAGGAGADALYGNSGKEVLLGFNPDEGDLLFDSSGDPGFAQSPPVINSTVDFTVDEGDAFAFTMTATDLDGTTNHTWSLEPIVGSPFPVGAFINPTTGELNFNPPDNGNFAALVRVTDTTNISTSRAVTFTVSNVNPIANAGDDQAATEGETVNLTGSFTDAGFADTHTVAWQIVNSANVIVATGTNSAISFVPADNGVYTATYTVTDDDGGTNSDSAQITVGNANPIANAGANQTALEGDTVNLTGSFTDAGSADTHTVAWQIVNSANSVVATGTNSAISFIPADNGVYTATYTVTDDDGGTNSDSALISVGNANPIANAGTDKTALEGDTVNLTGSFTDAGFADTHTFAWQIVNSANVVVATGTNSAISFVPADNGIYTATYTVTDDDGGTNSDSAQITVSNANPMANAGADQTALEGDTVNLTGSFTDAGSADTHTVAWQIVNSANVVVATGTNSAISFIPADNGIYTATYTVTDDDGGTNTDSAQITVGNANPMANAGADQTALEGDTVNLTGSFTDAGSADTHTVAWQIVNSANVAVASGTNSAISFVPADNGVYTATYAVTDDDGGTNSDSALITVGNSNPTATLAGPTTATAGAAVTITSTASDPAGANDPLTYAWIVTQDGNPFATQSGGTSYTFTPTVAGTYAVTLTVTDDDGGSTTVTRSVVVTGTTVNHPPTVTIQTPADGVFGVASLFTFTALDADGIDQNGLFVYSIDWGDGTSSTVTGPSVKTIPHAYARVSPTGTFKITARAQDARGAIGPIATANFAVLGWTVMADPIHPSECILVVVGSQGNDDIKVQDKNGDFLRVKIKDRDEQVRYKGTVFGDVDRILVFGLGGDDKITIDDDIDIDAQAWGGSGDDSIKAGSGNDVVFGEAGDDRLYGGDGRDMLVGGTGQDRVYGDKHDDILIGSYTAFDNEFNQLAPSSLFPASARLSFDDQRLAIEAIMAEWASNRSYTQRRTNISGTGTGPRNNGTKFLKFDASSVTDNTVFDDSVEDKIWGDSGLDWFLANTDGPSITRDDVKDRSGSEVVNDTDRWW